MVDPQVPGNDADTKATGVHRASLRGDELVDR